MEHLILSGLTAEQIPEVCRELGVGVDEDMMKKWQRTLEKASPIASFTQQPKLINRFSLGADPEFIMTTQLNEYVHAQDLAMDTLTAFGCDMSGRQAELRVHPSKFVLECVASIVDTLRWMYACHPNAQPLNWLATPYFEHGAQKDGCGGHLHFGRKRPQRKKEIAALDGVNNLLTNAKVFEPVATKQRMYNTIYGRGGDFRPQVHGYEYRTMPTWIPNPEVAFLTMVAAKLAILLPEALKPVSSVTQLKNLIYSFKHRDDDAAIMSRFIARMGLPKGHTQDFKKAWGVGADYTCVLRTHYIPSSIPPDMETMKEVFEWLVNGTPIPVRAPNPTWTPFRLPEGVLKVKAEAHTYGTSEVAMGLLSKGVSVMIKSGRLGQTVFGVESNIWNLKDEATKAIASLELPYDLYVGYRPDEGRKYITISLPPAMLDNHSPRPEKVRAIRALLQSGLFPIVKASQYADANFKETYLPAASAAKPVKRLAGNLRLNERGGLV
jgi:hypothetical protein